MKQRFLFLRLQWIMVIGFGELGFRISLFWLERVILEKSPLVELKREWWEVDTNFDTHIVRQLNG